MNRPNMDWLKDFDGDTLGSFRAKFGLGPPQENLFEILFSEEGEGVLNQLIDILNEDDAE